MIFRWMSFFCNAATDCIQVLIKSAFLFNAFYIGILYSFFKPNFHIACLFNCLGQKFSTIYFWKQCSNIWDFNRFLVSVYFTEEDHNWQYPISGSIYSINNWNNFESYNLFFFFSYDGLTYFLKLHAANVFIVFLIKCSVAWRKMWQTL